LVFAGIRSFGVRKARRVNADRFGGRPAQPAGMRGRIE